MIRSSVSVRPVGSLCCQMLEVNATGASLADVALWLAQHPWLSPCGRVAVEIVGASDEVKGSILASLFAVGFYELMVPVNGRLVTIASRNPTLVGALYPCLTLAAEGVSA